MRKGCHEQGRERIPNGSLTGRVALISGAARGIGLAIAQRFQSEGAKVFLLDCDAQAGSQAARDLTAAHADNPAIFLPADLRHESQINSAIEEVRLTTGRLDILVNNAAIEFERPFLELTTADWDSILSVNLRGAFLLTRLALPFFRRKADRSLT